MPRKRKPVIGGTEHICAKCRKPFMRPTKFITRCRDCKEWEEYVARSHRCIGAHGRQV